MTTKYQGWIYWGVCTPLTGVCAPSHGQRVCRGGGGYFHDKAKNIRDKMSNLSNNMISKLFVNKNYNTVIKQDFAVVK